MLGQFLKRYALKTSQRARQRRGELFRRLFNPTEEDRYRLSIIAYKA
jgi:hypothetical protein